VRIFNYSSIAVDRPLWHWLAERLSVNGQLRDAELIDKRELTVVVDRGRPRSQGNPDGLSTLGRISIYPCRDCNSGFVLVTFLHELFHAWLYQERESSYFAEWSENLCTAGAICLFCLLDGRINNAQPKCKRFLAPPASEWNRRRAALEEVVRSLRSCPARDLKKFFRPASGNVVMPSEALALLRTERMAGKRVACRARADSRVTKRASDLSLLR